jgi:YQGE family putative transporter
MIKRLLKKGYFDVPLNRGLICLYLGKTTVMAATALLGIFLPIFLYNLFGQNFRMVVAYYGIGYLIYGLTVVFGAMSLKRVGFKRALQFSTILGAIYYIVFYFMSGDNYFYLIPLAVFILIIYRLFYWVPYHTDFAKFSDKKNRGRQVSMFNATRSALGIFIPAIAGLIITYFNFNILFLIVIVLYFVSGVPYLIIPQVKEEYCWSFKETWKQVFSRERRKIVLAYMADGAENIVGVIIWPIFIFQLLKGNYFQVGAISTLIIGATVLAQLLLGKFIDSRFKKENVLRWGSFLYAAGWIVKVFIVTAYQIFLAGVYHSFTKIFVRTSVDSLTYELAADQGHYVDEFTVIHEIALNMGKAIMSLSIIIMSFFFGIQWVFILAALAVMSLNLLGRLKFKKFEEDRKEDLVL